MIGFRSGLYFHLLTGVQVDAVQFDDRVLFTGFGIFVGVGLGVECSVETGHFVLSDPTLVEPQPCDAASVGRPFVSACKGKLLFIDPIRDAVDDPVSHSVERELLFLSGFDPGDEQVVVPDEGNPGAVGRKGSLLLCSGFGERFQLFLPDVVDPIFGRKRSPIDGSNLCGEQQVFFVRTDRIIFDLNGR